MVTSGVGRAPAPVRWGPAPAALAATLAVAGRPCRRRRRHTRDAAARRYAHRASSAARSPRSPNSPSRWRCTTRSAGSPAAGFFCGGVILDADACRHGGALSDRRGAGQRQRARRNRGAGGLELERPRTADPGSDRETRSASRLVRSQLQPAHERLRRGRADARATAVERADARARRALDAIAPLPLDAATAPRLRRPGGRTAAVDGDGQRLGRHERRAAGAGPELSRCACSQAQVPLVSDRRVRRSVCDDRTDDHPADDLRRWLATADGLLLRRQRRAAGRGRDRSGRAARAITCCSGSSTSATAARRPAIRACTRGSPIPPSRAS